MNVIGRHLNIRVPGNRIFFCYKQLTYNSFSMLCTIHGGYVLIGGSSPRKQKYIVGSASTDHFVDI